MIKNYYWDFSQRFYSNEPKKTIAKTIAFVDDFSEQEEFFHFYAMLEEFSKKGLKVATVLNGVTDTFSQETSNKITCSTALLYSDLEVSQCKSTSAGIDYYMLKESKLFNSLYSKQDFIFDMVLDLKNDYDLVFVQISAKSALKDTAFIASFDHIFLSLTSEQSNIHNFYELMKEINSSSSQSEFFWMFREENSFAEGRSLFSNIQKTFNRFFGGKSHFLGNTFERSSNVFVSGKPHLNRDFSRIADLYIEKVNKKKLLNQTGSQVL